MILGDKVAGVLYHDNRLLSSIFKESDLDLLAFFAAQAAIALDNARAYSEIQRLNQKLHEEKQYYQEQNLQTLDFEEIVGDSPAIMQVLEKVEQVAKTDTAVLILGETGVGKELIARRLHAQSLRAGRPFIAVNCGAFTETLLESELFGYRKGAFTGAMADKRGLFEAADGGTIFLDEVGDTPPSMQVKLLRVLERGEVLPVGATEVRTVDTRVISATHKDLFDEIRAGRFREDLYYRLSAFPIRVPPLRERREDIAILVAHFLRRLSELWGRDAVRVAPEAMDCLGRYAWPGNVRELQHELERALTLAGRGTTLGPEHFSERVVGGGGAHAARLTGSLKQARDAFERDYVLRALRAHQGNVSHTARALGISRVMLQRKMKDFGLRQLV